LPPLNLNFHLKKVEKDYDYVKNNTHLGILSIYARKNIAKNRRK